MSSRRLRPVLVVSGLAALLGASACHFADAKLWNLEQVHEPDGKAKRRGRIRSDWGYFLGNLMERSNFGGEDFQQAQQQEKRIKDPLGVCLENLIELGRCRPDEKVAALQASAFCWLGIDCEYVLSRERAVLELGGLAQRLELKEPVEPPAESTSLELVKQRYDELVASVRQVLAAPDLAGSTLADTCETVRQLAPDRPGTLRLLRASTALLERREQASELEPLHALRLDLARRAVALTLVEARRDPHGLVRAAALESGVRAFPAQRAELLRWALATPADADPVVAEDELSLRALELLARYGLPTEPAAGSSAEDAERVHREWIELLVQPLRTHLEDRHTTAACRALARATGRPENLRPESWVLWWRVASSEASAEASTDPIRESGSVP